MSNAAPPGKTPPAPPRELQWLPGLLSFLVPGLGQLYQGRISKGVVFLVCIYGLFFYGMWLGSGAVRAAQPDRVYSVSGSVYLPKASDNSAPLANLPPLLNALYNRPQYIGQFFAGIVAWPALIQYWQSDSKAPLLGDFERTPSNEALTVVYTYGDKVMDLGWVYSVIAGVLNILVIYDALAGPAFLPRKPEARKGVA